MGNNLTAPGVVEINGKRIDVRYRYIDFHTIECKPDNGGEEFLTHYKSLVV